MESGILDLKAELYKNKLAAEKEILENFRKAHQIKKLWKKSKEATHDVKNKNSSKESVQNEEEEKKLSLSRSKLEEKSKLYDQLKSGVDVLETDELNERFLVNFQENIYNKIDKKRQNENLEHKNESTIKDKPIYDSEIAYIKSMHGKWEEIEENSKNKNSVHYSDVLFDEARSHGAGFMKFSTDEEIRAQQQQHLKDLSEETSRQADERSKVAESKKKEMQLRLAKVRQKKRLKMGLPVKGDPLDLINSDLEENKQSQEKILEETPKIPDLMSTNNKPTKRIREWDLGKADVPNIPDLEIFKIPEFVQDCEISKSGILKISDSSFKIDLNPQNIQKSLNLQTEFYLNKSNFTFGKKSKLLSQEQWIEANRNERCSKFAPPTNYNQFAPPTSYNPRSTKHKVFPKNKNGKKCDNTKFSKNQHKKFGNNKNDNIKNKPSSSDYNSSSVDSQTRNLDFAPPCTSDYYRSSYTKKSKLHIDVNIKDSVERGLSTLRKNI